MKINFYTVKDNLDTTRGYGVAGERIFSSLELLGHKVGYDTKDADVGISFCAPQAYKFYPHQYKIGYTPWESTELPGGWLKHMNACDEVWATSPWVAEVYRNAGVTVPVHVYEHGINSKWVPVERPKKDVIKFLHIGEPALRKGGQMAVDAFRAAFGDQQDVELTMKCYEQHWLRAWTEKGFTTPDKGYSNVNIIPETISPNKLMALYHSHDVMVYPTYGEGFGFIPLQALATGMPTICTDDWAPYKKYLGPLSLSGRYDRSIWSVHPGNVYYPKYDELVDLYKYAYNNIDDLKEYYMSQAPQIPEEFDWLKKTEEAWEHIFKRFTDK